MTTLVVCPACGGKLNAPSHLLGRMGKCPQCGKTIKIVASAAPTPAGERPVAAPPPRPPVEPKKAAAGIKVVRLDSGANEAAPSPPTSGNPRIALGLGIPALILGVLACSFGWVPGVGLLSMPLSGLGFLLGIAGLVVAIAQRGRGIAFPIAGSAVSLFALALAICSLGLFGVRLPWFASNTPKIEEVVAEPPRPTVEPPVTPAKEKGPTWHDASKGPVQQGDIRVQLAAVAVRNVRIRDLLGEETVSPSKQLVIEVLVDNTSATRKIDYLGWSGATANPLALTDLLSGATRGKSNVLETLTAPERNAATLRDDHGNEYKRLALEAGAQVPGQVNTATSVYPGKQVQDLLVFEPPIAKIQYLRLKLPAAAFGGTGELGLQISQRLIQR